MKAIQTIYKGYKFRSRLEARWAVFFDAMGLEWEYEQEGFDLGDGVYYLPDFKIKDFYENIYYVEIKGGVKDGVKLTDEDKKKVMMLAEQSVDDVCGVIVLGDLPPANLEHCFFVAEKKKDKKSWQKSVDCKMCFWGIWTLLDYVPIDMWRFTKVPDGMATVPHNYYSRDYSDVSISNYFIKVRSTVKRVDDAYTKARQARFEHGETPK